MENHAELVHEDLFARVVLLDRGGIDDLPELRLDEEVTEDGKLDSQVPHLITGRLTPREPLGVRVAHNNRMILDEVARTLLECVEIDHLRHMVLLVDPINSMPRAEPFRYKNEKQAPRSP